MNNELLQNIEKIHTTPMGFERIKRNLSLDLSDEQVLDYCKNKILEPSAKIERIGKNWYITDGNAVLTVNAYSFTIITAHKDNK